MGIKPLPEHLLVGKVGERYAKRFLRKKGMKFLTANFRGKHGELDLVFRDGEYLVFVEVKTRTDTGDELVPIHPSLNVNETKRENLRKTAFEYLHLLKKGNRPTWRMDVVEVWLDENRDLIRLLHTPGVRTRSGFSAKNDFQSR